MPEIKPALHAPSEPSGSERRRTQRVQIAMPVIVRCKDAKPPIEEKTQTISVNANGCLIRMQAQLIRNQKVFLVNPHTTEELPCTVMFLGKKDGGKTEVGLEFAEASPLFWRISFPPEDWDPSERKRPTTTPMPPPTAANPHRR
jgi:PilZ domain